MQSVARVKALNACMKCYILHRVVYVCVAGCEYGNKASWCANYIRGADECLRPEVAQLCCHSCSSHIPALPITSNDASFLALLFLIFNGVARILCQGAQVWRCKKTENKCMYCTTPGSNLYSRVCVIALACVSFTYCVQ